MEQFWESLNGWFEGGALQALIDTLLIALLAVICLWISRRIFRGIQKRMGSRRTNLRFLQSIVRTLIILFALLGILYQIKPLRGFLTSLLAGSGVVAVFIGLASQQSLSNFVSGLLISTAKPFAEGDRVKLRDIGVTAIAESVTILYSKFRTFDNSLIVVPNSVLDKMVIENTDVVGDRFCNFFDIAISGQSDLLLAMETVRDIAERHPLCLDQRTEEELAEGKPKVPVRLVDIDGNALKLRASIWTESPALGYTALCEIRRDVKLRVSSCPGSMWWYPRSLWKIPPKCDRIRAVKIGMKP